MYDSKKELNNIIEINVFTAYENYIYLETKQSDEGNDKFANKNRTLAINTSKFEANYVGEKLDYIYTFGFLNSKILAKCRAENYSEKKPSYACYSFDLDGTNQKLEHSLKTGDNLSVDNKYIYLFNNLDVNKKKRKTRMIIVMDKQLPFMIRIGKKWINLYYHFLNGLQI